MKIEVNVDTIGLPMSDDIQRAVDDLKNNGIKVYGIANFEFKDNYQTVCHSVLTVYAEDFKE